MINRGLCVQYFNTKICMSMYISGSWSFTIKELSKMEGKWIFKQLKHNGCSTMRLLCEGILNSQSVMIHQWIFIIPFSVSESENDWVGLHLACLNFLLVFFLWADPFSTSLVVQNLLLANMKIYSHFLTSINTEMAQVAVTILCLRQGRVWHPYSVPCLLIYWSHRARASAVIALTLILQNIVVSAAEVFVEDRSITSLCFMILLITDISQISLKLIRIPHGNLAQDGHSH